MRMEVGGWRAELDELARDSGRADVGATTDQVVARLDAQTRIREGEPAELWADTRSIHVFDLETGRNLTAGESQTGQPGRTGQSGKAAQKKDKPAPSAPTTN